MNENADPLLGYVAQVIDEGAYYGGLLLLTVEGDPIEFAYTDRVEVTSLQRILLGKRMETYVVSQVLTPPLWDRVQKKPQALCFDEASLLERTLSLPAPVVVFADMGAGHRPAAWTWQSAEADVAAGAWHQVDRTRQTTALLEVARTAMSPIDIREPFRQLREAIVEARKGGKR